MNDYNVIVGKIIKEIRQEKGITQDQIAKVIFKDRSTYANYESGKRSMNLDLFVDICTFLNVNPNEVLEKVLNETSERNWNSSINR